MYYRCGVTHAHDSLGISKSNGTYKQKKQKNSLLFETRPARIFIFIFKSRFTCFIGMNSAYDNVFNINAITLKAF